MNNLTNQFNVYAHHQILFLLICACNYQKLSYYNKMVY